MYCIHHIKFFFHSTSISLFLIIHSPQACLPTESNNTLPQLLLDKVDTLSLPLLFLEIFTKYCSFHNDSLTNCIKDFSYRLSQARSVQDFRESYQYLTARYRFDWYSFVAFHHFFRQSKISLLYASALHLA